MKSDARDLPKRAADASARYFVRRESWESIKRFQREIIDDVDEYKESKRAAAGSKKVEVEESGQGVEFRIVEA